jgi:choline dehydrogenase-like flavoprotein
VKSPQILELSGIGRDNVLSLIGVDTKLNLPGVGENVQEHYTGGIIYELGSNIEGETWDLMRDSVYATNALRLQYVKSLCRYRNTDSLDAARRARAS